MKKRIFDCFTFFDEIELLEMRLLEQYDHVDMFVIVEADVTFQGNPKPLHFHDNHQRFARFSDKITVITVTDLPAGGTPWDREHHQRNAIRQILPYAAPEDMIIVSDADELIRRETLDFLRANDGYFMLDMAMYQYFMNFHDEAMRWTKPFAFTRSLADKIPDFNHIRTHQDAVLAALHPLGRRIDNAGWHFTYLGGPDRVRNKLRAFSHTDGWHAAMLADGALEAQVHAGYHVGECHDLCVYKPIDETFPRVVVSNQDALTRAGWIRDPFEALRAAHLYARSLDFHARDLEKRLAELQTRHDALRAYRALQAPPDDPTASLHSGHCGGTGDTDARH